MTTELTPTVDDDAPALAGAIVYHAKTVCETTDHLWKVLDDISIPTDSLTDNRQQHKVTFEIVAGDRVCNRFVRTHTVRGRRRRGHTTDNLFEM